MMFRIMDAPADDVPEETPETEPSYYSITLPWYEDVVYMVDEGRVFRPENERPEDIWFNDSMRNHLRFQVLLQIRVNIAGIQEF